MEMNKAQTNKGIVILLFFQILFFLGHIVAHGLKLDWNQLFQYSDTIATIPLFLLYLFCRIGSIGYLVGLGFFGINDCPKTLVLFILSSLIYVAASLLWAGQFGFSTVLSQSVSFFHTAPLIIVVILYPFVSKYKQCKVDKDLILLIIISILYYFGYRLALNKNDHSADINIIYFLAGILSAKYYNTIVKYSDFLGMSALGILLTSAFVFPNKLIIYVANYNDILYVIIAIALCVWASKCFDKDYKFVKALSLEIGLPFIGIYLLTDNQVFIKNGYPSLLIKLSENWIVFVCEVVAFIFIAIVTHRLLSYVLSYFYDIFYRRVFEKK